ncbi:orotate phosphoribosyltransferase [Ligilactobacillus murinus DSM 20452 = NBRC 14221]|uniref:Orotate phosphoribosyltransferase n=1 Tax=Ligilactobacillus murinus DSM 20452 = NBRC 14221 TaxID=1423772 RepID=A0A0R2B409_9LACO|nr:orotate phosphoribosyltransferase [Ligilactobacillus murinus]GFI62689.1 orotate phosphoribosyltransferase [Lactobacillaceae bacterium]HAP23711.1 orotate phosphoribosyltransferase [Lactobacillus sp.]KRM70291.1 orotate phosphoribosyltransferase [Ligilactobacillus murinus DSM 20452 = NBRC 14221]MCR1890457.1 orotate phosphoribosyltransferase [Ligilactobacillus murinus]TGY53103.1 orotate phosphoribosyltransferase [Ligilactobacillus murinus]
MKEIAKDLLKIQAVKLSPNEPFTWASGIKSPIYCDNRLTISYPKIRTAIAKGIAELISEKYPKVEVIAGTATAGIPHAAWIAAELDLPLVYVRSKPKDHGRGKQIEGVLHPGAKTVVIDDLLSTGGSVLKAVKAAQNEGADVLGVGAIFSYQLQAIVDNFRQADLSYFTLTNYSELLEAAVETNYISTTERAALEKWRHDPENWSAKA